MADPRRIPDLVPTLLAGKHRNPHKGACFMEMASFLAGERWSDHPPCTHPLLAELALMVNDNVSDTSRQELLPLVPSVIGLASDDPHVDPQLALFVACAALPISAEPTQRALAVGVLTCNRVLASLDGQQPDALTAESKLALAAVPLAATWAEQFSSGMVPSPRAFRRHAAASIVRLSVRGIAAAAVAEPEHMLCDLLRQAIDRFPGWAGSTPTPAQPTFAAQAVRGQLTLDRQA